MQFIFYGTLDELKATIHRKAKEHSKDIVIYHNQPDVLEIDFKRLSHSGGRFFIAHVTEDANKVTLDGETKDVFANQKKSKAGRILRKFAEYCAAYIFLEILLAIPWIFSKDIVRIWIFLILPVIYLIIRYFLNKRYDNKLDQAFVEFMDLCTAYPTDEQNWYDVYKKLDLGQGKLETICDDANDMLLITYEDGMQIAVSHIPEDQTYCIIVEKDKESHPLGVFTMIDKAKLPAELQKAIGKFRNI